MGYEDNQQRINAAPADAELPRQRMLTSDDILGGPEEVLISHHGAVVRLRETRNGKLILGK